MTMISCYHNSYINYYNYEHYNMIFATYYLEDYLAYRLLKNSLTEKKNGVKYETSFKSINPTVPQLFNSSALYV